MLYWSVVFYTLALIASLLGFGGITSPEGAIISKFLFVGFMLLGFLSLLADRKGWGRRW